MKMMTRHLLRLRRPRHLILLIQTTRGVIGVVAVAVAVGRGRVAVVTMIMMKEAVTVTIVVVVAVALVTRAAKKPTLFTSRILCGNKKMSETY